MRRLWLTIGIVALVLGITGIILPLVPATLFMVLAAWAFSKSSPRLQSWILSHSYIGPPVVDWRKHGVIRRGAKIAALAGIFFSVGLAMLLRIPAALLAGQVIVLAAVALFIWTRPETPG